MSLEPEASDNLERPVTPSRRRVNAPVLRSQSRQEEIRLACLKGDLTSLESLIKGNTENLNELFQDGWSPLMVAVNGANPAIVKYLLGQGADPNKCRTDGFSPLMAALTSSKSRVLVQQCAQLLIDAGADVNSRSEDGLSPIFLAVKDNRVPIVDVLVFHGADISVKDSSGRTVSQLAQERGLDQILLTLEKSEKDKLNGVDGIFLNTEDDLNLKSQNSKSNTTPKNPATPENSPVSSSTTLDQDEKLMDANYKLNTKLAEVPTPVSLEEKEINEYLEMVKKDNVLAAIESNTGTLPGTLDSGSLTPNESQTNQETSSENRQPLKYDTPEKSSPPKYSSSSVDSHSKGNDAIILKIGLVVGLFASMMGAYYAKAYFQNR